MAAKTYDKDIDYSKILKNLMETGGTAEEVGDVLAQRTEKTASEPGLSNYANDNIYQSALNYIAHYKRPAQEQPESALAGQTGTAGRISALTDDLLNREDFSYDHTTDPVYAQYEAEFTRKGEQAMQDTVGQVSARTGGLASSYAATAGQQVYNGHMAELADKIPTLYQQAYERYLAEYSMDKDNLDELQEQEATAFNRERDQEETLYNRSMAQEDTQYSRMLDQVSIDNEQQKTAAAGKQQEIENALSVWTTNGYATQDVANALGVPVGTPTTDQSYNNWYTKYTQSKAAGGGSGSGSGDAADLSDAEKAFNGGDQSDSVIQALMAQDYTQEAIENAGYKGKYFTDGNSLTTFSDYGTAVEYMKSKGVSGDKASGMMTKSEWQKRKSGGGTMAEVAYYDTYEEYLAAYVQFAAENA